MGVVVAVPVVIKEVTEFEFCSRRNVREVLSGERENVRVSCIDGLAIQDID
jgi:hypothetical protein